MESTLPVRYLKLRLAAEYVGMSVWKLRQLIAEGAIVAVQDVPGGSYTMDIKDLDAYMAAHKTKPKEPPKTE